MAYVSVLLPAILIAAVVALIVRAQFQAVTIYEWDTGLLYENGRFRELLAPGRHWLVKTFRKPEVITIRTADQFAATGLVDASSAERLPFRLSLWFAYTITDPRRFHERMAYQEIVQTMRGAAVELAAGCKLEELLAGRAEANARLLELAAPRLADCKLIEVQVDTIQLPPETRRLFVEVEKARLEGAAALARARGEHASLRALANAARLLKDNPELANLRLLQSVAGSQKGATTIVLGQGALAGYPPTAKAE